MTVYGLIATVFICASAIVCVALLVSQPLRIEFTRKSEEVNEATQSPATPTKLEEEEEDLNKVEKASLDAVIRAANELMGINMEDSNGQTE